jgi:hypothetical protein
MTDQSPLLSRIEKALGPSASTMFAERGDDRRLIAEVSAGAAALLVVGEFLKGFLEGVGVKDAGKKLGVAVVDAVKFAASALSGSDQSINEVDLNKHAAALAEVVDTLKPYRMDAEASASGLSRLRTVLEEHGVPRSEAARIAEDVQVAIWLS